MTAGLETPMPAGFVLQTKLGEGGMGAVYLCRQTSLDRLVAVKVLSASWVDLEAALHRLEDEARVMARLSHPHVVMVHDFLPLPGEGAAIIMEYVEGGSLRHWLQQTGNGRGLLLPEALRWLRQIAEGLAAAHRLGVVHRDIKPENILIDPNGNAKVTDFGLAQPGAAQATEWLTETGSTGGTLDYMAPEQFEDGASNTHTDVYAFGVLAYEMLTGHLPRGNFDSPHDLRRDVPAAWDAVIMRALKSQPADRFASMDAVLKKLPDGSTPKKRYSKAAASLALLPLAGAVWWWQARNPEPISTPPSPAIIAEASPVSRQPWRDALAGIHLDTQTYSGFWQQDASGALISDDNISVLALRQEMPVSYDVRTRFTRLDTDYPPVLFFRTQQGMGCAVLDAWNKGLSGIHAIDGKDLIDGYGFHFKLETGRQYEILLEVRPHEVRMHVDGVLHKKFNLAGRILSLTPYWNWDLDEKPAALAIGSAQSPTRFHSVEWRPTAPTEMAP